MDIKALFTITTISLRWLLAIITGFILLIALAPLTFVLGDIQDFIAWDSLFVGFLNLCLVAFLFIATLLQLESLGVEPKFSVSARHELKQVLAGLALAGAFGLALYAVIQDIQRLPFDLSWRTVQEVLWLMLNLSGCVWGLHLITQPIQYRWRNWKQFHTQDSLPRTSLKLDVVCLLSTAFFFLVLSFKTIDADDMHIVSVFFLSSAIGMSVAALYKLKGYLRERR